MLHARTLLLALPLLASACLVDDEPDVGTADSELVTEVPSLDGLPGYYTRVPLFGAPGELLTVWLDGETNPDGTTSDGSYLRTVAPWFEVETGHYHAIPNNPAIGWAAITFLDDETGDFDAYFIGGIARDLLGRITTVSLIHLGPDDEFGLPFLIQRVY